MGDWKATSRKQQCAPVIPEKKRRKMAKTKGGEEKHMCLQCMEIYITGKQPKPFVSLARIDPSSVKRHKERRHSDESLCTIVPAKSPEITDLKKKLAAKKAKTCRSSTLAQDGESDDDSGDDFQEDSRQSDELSDEEEDDSFVLSK